MRAITIVGLLTPTVAAAHEVYVLPPDVVRGALTMPTFSGLSTAFAHVD